MNGSCLNFDSPIRDAISRIRFAPLSNNLLISSWDSTLRLFDVDKCELRFEAPNGGSGLLDCCFESESVALTANSDGSVIRYDMGVGNSKAIGKHEDLATCIEYSEEKRQVISAGWDKKVKIWDPRSTSSLGCLSSLGMEVESMSLSGLSLMIAHKSSVHLYDLRHLDKSFEAKEYFMDIHIKCVRTNSELEGFIAGSVDGRVALKHVGQSKTDEGYAFRCYPKDKNGKHLVAVNDIAFNPSLRGVVVTGDNEGYATIWDVIKRRRLLEFPRFPNSVASLACNHGGQLLAVASSYTYQEANEREEHPQIFMHHLDAQQIESISASSSTKTPPPSPSPLRMSDEEHQFESKADAGASKTYPQQAGTIRKNGYIVIKGRPCKVVEVSTSKTGKHGHAKCHFVAIDIFTSKKLEDIVPSSHNCDVPHVNRTDYQLIDISEDGFVSLLTDNGNTKDDLRLPTDEALLTQIKDGFAEGKDLVVSVMSAMGEEQICALKDIGPK
ncbi:mitotic checkpoint protein BUB3.3-like [Salvia splendens]|nr:mitotic checkpoint protein BUB3.3-like [Salvia splendens]